MENKKLSQKVILIGIITFSFLLIGCDTIEYKTGKVERIGDGVVIIDGEPINFCRDISYIEKGDIINYSYDRRFESTCKYVKNIVS